MTATNRRVASEQWPADLVRHIETYASARLIETKGDASCQSELLEYTIQEVVEIYFRRILPFGSYKREYSLKKLLDDDGTKECSDFVMFFPWVESCNENDIFTVIEIKRSHEGGPSVGGIKKDLDRLAVISKKLNKSTYFILSGQKHNLKKYFDSNECKLSVDIQHEKTSLAASVIEDLEYEVVLKASGNKHNDYQAWLWRVQINSDVHVMDKIEYQVAALE